MFHLVIDGVIVIIKDSAGWFLLCVFYSENEEFGNCVETDKVFIVKLHFSFTDLSTHLLVQSFLKCSGAVSRFLVSPIIRNI